MELKELGSQSVINKLFLAYWDHLGTIHPFQFSVSMQALN